MNELTSQEIEMMQRISPSSLRKLDQLAARLRTGKAVPAEKREYDQRLVRIRQECAKRLPTAPQAIDAQRAQVDADALHLRAQLDAGEIGPVRYKVETRELAIRLECLEAGIAYRLPLERLKAFRLSGQARKLYSEILGCDIALICQESQRPAATQTGLPVYTIHELELIWQHALFDEVAPLAAVKGAFDGTLVAVQPPQENFF